LTYAGIYRKMPAMSKKTTKIQVLVPQDLFKIAKEKCLKNGHTWQWLFIELLKAYIDNE